MIKIAICDDDMYICAEIERVILNFEKTMVVKMDVEIFYSGEIALMDYLQDNISESRLLNKIKLILEVDYD